MPRYERVAVSPGALPTGTESCLAIMVDPEATIAQREAAANWARGLAERIDKAGQRRAAIRAAGRLLRQDTPNATVEAVHAEVEHYLRHAWRRSERDLAAPPQGASPLRVEIWRIARLSDGAGVCKRTIEAHLDFYGGFANLAENLQTDPPYNGEQGDA